VTALDNFDDRYLGQFAADPTLDNDGNALLVGALYFNTVINKMKTWTGTSWSVTFSDSSTASAVGNDSSYQPVGATTVALALNTLVPIQALLSFAGGTGALAYYNSGTSSWVSLAGPGAAGSYLLTGVQNGAPTWTQIGSGLTLSGGVLSASTATGDVVGPASATDNAIVRYDGTTGKLVQSSGVTLDDSDVMTTAGRIISTKNGALDAPTIAVTGTPISGGTATTTKPLVSLEMAGATSTGWDTNGTLLGINVTNGFNGRVIDIQRNGVSLLHWSPSTAWRFGSNIGITVAGGTLTWTGLGNTVLTSPAAATLQLGSYDSATPVAQTIRVQGSRGGTDTNISGANLTIQSGTGTGNSASSKLIFRTPTVGSTGNSAQTMATGLEIQNGAPRIPQSTLANLPSPSACGEGALYYTTNGTYKLVYSDGSAWRYVVDGTVAA